jgi:glutathione S-transferase
MLTIYGSDLSGPANKCRFVANYLKLPYEYHRINLMEGEQKKEWFLKVNPLGKVPAIKDDDFCLFESGAIIKYLCSKSPSSLYPEDAKQKAVVDQWIDFSTIHINVNISKLLYNRVFAPRRGWPVSAESIADGEKFLGQFLPEIEKQLSQHKNLACDLVTLADMTLLAALDPAEVAGLSLASYPKINQWRQGLMSQEFYTKVHKEYGELLKQPASK